MPIDGADGDPFTAAGELSPWVYDHRVVQESVEPLPSTRPETDGSDLYVPPLGPGMNLEAYQDYVRHEAGMEAALRKARAVVDAVCRELQDDGEASLLTDLTEAGEAMRGWLRSQVPDIDETHFAMLLQETVESGSEQEPASRAPVIPLRQRVGAAAIADAAGLTRVA